MKITPDAPSFSSATAIDWPQLEQLAALVSDGLWYWDIEHDTMQYSGRWGELIGLIPSELPSSLRSWVARIHPDDKKRVLRRFEAHFEGLADAFDCDFRIRHKDGTFRPVLSRAHALRRPDGSVYAVVGSLVGRQEPAIYDPLTGLPNRTMLLDRLRHALERYRRDDGHTFAVLFMDLDNFKVTNDSLGHRVGDMLLVEMAKRLQLCVRSGDTVARLGGDEFVVLLEGIESRASLERIVSRIERYTASTFNLDGHKVLSSASIGVVCDMHPYRHVDEIIRDADIAMYHAKKANLSSAYFDQAMFKRASRRQQLEVELRQGLERNEFFLVYQPIVRFGSGSVVGYEALVRWMHPKDGMVPPEVFIGIAEETGLIVPLGEWVLLEACRSILKRSELPNAEPDFYVSVNVSSVQLARSDFLDQVADILVETGVDPQRLVFEVTESDIMEDQQTAARALGRLKELGIRIALDDFGTGYSSLSYIHSLPLDMLKIDGSFIRRLEMDPKSVEIVRTFVNLARSLQLASVSEGVETPDQASILEDLNVSHAQGYYYAEPSRLD